MLNEVVDFIFDWIKNHSIWNYIFFKEGIQGFFIFMKHDLSINRTIDFVIETEVSYVFKMF